MRELRVTPGVPHAVPLRHDHRDLMTVQDEAEVTQSHRCSGQLRAAPVLHRRFRSECVGVYNGGQASAARKQSAQKIVRQDTMGRQKMCTVATARIYASQVALELLRRERVGGWILTDSQELLQRIAKGGRSGKSRAVVLAARREISMIKEQVRSANLL